MNHHAIPREIWKQMEEVKKNAKAMKQSTLDGKFDDKGKQAFMRDGVLHAVAQLIACDDQV